MELLLFIGGPLVLLVLFQVVRVAFGHRGGPTLVLRKFHIPSADTAPIEISGRAAGFLAWLLTKLGIDTETTLTVTEREVLFRGTSLSGISYQVVPLLDVSSTHCAYRQPVWLLVLGSLFVLFGFLFIALGFLGPSYTMDEYVQLAIVGIIIGVVCVVVYKLQKKIRISVESTGGMLLGLTFKRSVIENVSVDMSEGIKAIEAINQRVMVLKAILPSRVAGSAG